MPSLDETRQSLLHGEERVTRKANRFIDSFSDFALQDNVLEVAVGLILGAAFTLVVTSFISDLLLPPLSLLPFLGRNLDERFTVLKKGPNFYGNGTEGYYTVAQANEDGAVVMSWGAFLNKVINFLGLGLALFALASLYEWASKDPIIKHTVKCKYCRKRISEKAKRCLNCTSWQDGRED